MARKTVSEQDRALAFITTATLEELDALIQSAILVRSVKWPAVMTSRSTPTKRIKKVKAAVAAAGTFPDIT